MNTRERWLWWFVASASILGLISSLLQTIERINYAVQPTVSLTCNINAVFSCSNVFDAWQSRVFGFPNSLVCMMFFGLTAGLALAAATGSQPSRSLRAIFHFCAIFFLGFGAWYLWQSTYRIGYICIFCLFCYAAVIGINWAWFRLWSQQISLNQSKNGMLSKFINKGGDVLIAIAWGLAVTAMIFFHFR